MSDEEQSLEVVSDTSEEKKKEVNPPSQGITLDDACLTEAKSALPKTRGKLTPQFIERFSGYLSRGVPMSNCALYLGVSQSIVFKWFKDGQAEVDALDEEAIKNADGDIASLVSLQGQFYLACCEAKAKPVVELQDMLYDRAFEAGKEWLATYILERMCPETYNLKYKIQQDVSANVNANVVEFKFVDGPEARSLDELDYLNTQMEALKDKYASSDIIDVTPEEDEGGSDE